MENEWRKVGEIGVDAGVCWIGDPCYVIPSKKNHYGHKSSFEELGLTDWGKFCDSIEYGAPTLQQYNYPAGHSGLGVLVSSGFGDGTYDVYAKVIKTDWGTRVKELKVVFIDEEFPDAEDSDILSAQQIKEIEIKRLEKERRNLEEMIERLEKKSND